MKSTEHFDAQIDERLRHIARELFGPSRETLTMVALGDDQVKESLPLPLQQQLAEPYCARQIEILRNTFASSEIRAACDLTALTPPAPRRTSPPKRGEIWVVESVDLSSSSPLKRYTEPLFVLLNKRASQHPDEPKLPDVWQAWAVSAHAGFAGHWDALIQGNDVPSTCAMVQVWNLVNVAEEHLGRRRFQLNEVQMAQIDAVWQEYVMGGDEPASDDSQIFPFSMGMRTTPQGITVVTGSSSTRADDPRIMFRRLYLLAANAVGAAGRSLLESHAGGLRDLEAVRGWVRVIQSMMTGGINSAKATDSEMIRATSDREGISSSNQTDASSIPKDSDWVRSIRYEPAKRTLTLDFRELEESQFSLFEFRFFAELEGNQVKKVDASPHVAHGVESFGKFILSSEDNVVEALLTSDLVVEMKLLTDESQSRYLVNVTLRKS